eukprot:COSAG06_NODE_21211_length_765_cov_1.756757_1_plen_80_part_01
MLPQDTDFPDPVADAPLEPPPQTQEEDTNAVVSPTHSDFVLTKTGAKVAAYRSRGRSAHWRAWEWPPRSVDKVTRRVLQV